MKKLIFFLAIVLLCSPFGFAQLGTWQPKNLTGSFIECTSGYLPGISMNIPFRLNIFPNDGEWPDLVSMTFPAEFNITSATNPLPGFGQSIISISGNTVSWGLNSNNGAVPVSYKIPFTGNNSFICSGISKLCQHGGCGGQYLDNANGYTVIYPSSTSALHIKGSYDTEQGYDYISIFKGVGTNGQQLFYNSGSGTVDCTGDPGQPVTVKFSSDASVSWADGYSGFSLYVFPDPINFNVKVIVNPAAIGNYIVPWYISGNNYGGNSSDASGSLTLTKVPMHLQLNPVFPTCGQSDGSISVSVFSGEAPYTYQWRDPSGSVTSSISGLDVGTYRVVVTDSIGYKDSAEIVLNNIAGPAIYISSCSNTTGNFLAVTATGSGPFSYSWSDNSTNDTIYSYNLGLNSVTVTDDLSSCRKINSILVNEYPAILEVYPYKEDRACIYSTSGGLAGVWASGGTPGYNYIWSNGGTNNEISNPILGLNTVTVSDVNGCIHIDTINVNIPLPIQINSSIWDISCFGNNDGEIDLVVEGGNPGYSYIWSVPSFTNYVYDLSPGTYSVTVTDYKHCIDSATFTITEPPQLVVQTNATDAVCGSNNGTADVTVSGGIPPYSYLWDEPFLSTTSSISGLTVGLYHVSVYDFNSCSVFSQTVISNSGGPIDTIYTVNATCTSLNNGKAWVHVSSGVLPYTYLWSGNISVTDTAYNLAPGIYSLTLTDGNGCSTVQTFEITEPQLSFIKVNPTCQNYWDGLLTVNVTGGTSPFTYSWGGPNYGYDQTIYGPAGSYSITVYDSQGCSINGYAELTAPPAPIVNFTSINNPTCYGLSNGSVLVSIAGGAPPFQYYWYNDINYNIEGTTKDMINLPGGPYYYECSDALGCWYSFGSVTLTEPSQITIGFVSSNPSCGNNDGSISALANNGYEPYFFSWNNGTFNDSINNLGSGIYTVVVTDYNGCIARDSTVIASAFFEFIDNVTNVTCYGGTDGEILLDDGSGYKMLYNFQWSSGASGFHATGLSAGNHSVTITDNFGCTDIMIIYVDQPSETMMDYDFGNVSCSGESTGWIDIYNIWGGVYGGGGGAKLLTDSNETDFGNGRFQPKSLYDYSLTWYFEGELISANTYIENLAAGTYTAIVIDNISGCTKPFEFIITEPSLIFESIATPISCNGESDGKIVVNATSNRTGIFKYSIDEGPFQTNNTFEGLSFGDHELYTQFDYSGNICEKYQGIVTILQPNPLSGFVSTTPVLCQSGNSGTITVVGSGGTLPYNYSINGGAFQPASLFNNVLAGNYTVSIIDSRGCSYDIPGGVTVTEIPQLTAVLTSTPVSCNAESNGIISATVSGGTDPITYLWSIDSTSSSISGLTAASYSVVIRDINNCTLVKTAVVTEPAAVTVSIVGTNIICNGSINGAATAVALGGVGQYDYLWSIDSITNSVSGLSASSYSVTVNDANNCVAIGSVFINEPDTVLSGNITVQTDILCFGLNTGSVTVAGAGGTPGYTYSIDGGAFQISGTFNSIVAGIHSVTVKDTNNCTVNIAVNITQPSAVLSGSLIAQTDILCFGLSTGSVTVLGSGGISGYTYSIDGGTYQGNGVFNSITAGTHVVSVKDVNGCSVSVPVTIAQPATALSGSITSQTNILCFGLGTGSVTVIGSGGTSGYTYSIDSITYQATSTFSGLFAGAYTVSVKDLNNCIVDVPVNIIQPTVTLSCSIFSQTDILCFGSGTGSVTVVGLGGTPGYTYSIDGSTYLPSGNFSVLLAGLHNVFVKDANDCIATVSLNINQPVAALTGNIIAQTDIPCFGSGTGSVSVLGLNGTPGYTYSVDGGIYQIGGNFSGLYLGGHNISVKDTNGCTVNIPVTIIEPSLLIVDVAGTNVFCNGVGTGTAVASVSGGVGSYSFLWSNDSITNTISGLTAGTYYLTVTDGNNCTAMESVILTEPALLTAPVTATDVLCFGDNNNGTITVVGTGGTLPYLYSINGGTPQGNSMFSGLQTGNYSVTVTDSNGCIYQLPGGINISEPNVLSAVLISTPVSCYNGNDGAITSVINGGVMPYSYIWSNNASTSSISGLTAATYSVVVKDYNNCIVLKAVNITEPAILTSDLIGTNVLCNGANNGTALVTASGGVGSYSYLWSNGSTSDSVSGLAVSTYTVTVKDGNNCSVSDTIIITEPDLLLIALSSTESACNICNGTATITATGGTIPYSYNWSNNDIFPITDSLCAGTVIVTVTDYNGCTGISNITITSQALSSIFGEAHWSDGNLPDNTANVEFYRILNLTQAELAYTIPLTGSQFSISNIDYGQYFLKVNIIDGTLLPNVLSTYLDSIHLWEYADTLNIECESNYNLHVPMYEMNQPVGPPIGVISGYITYADYPGGGKGITAVEGVKLVGEPVPGAEIYVELEPDDEPIINTTTNDTGYYEVSGLEGGNTYTISVDIPGLPMINTYTNISINSDSTMYTQMNFFVDTSETNGGIFINASSPVIKHENATFKLEMYPNPFNDYLNISYSLNKYCSVNIEIYDVSGKVVAALVNEKQAEGSYKYVFNASTSNLAEGTYIVKVQVDNTVFIKKIIQIK